MTTIQVAKEILGESNVFGPEDWNKHFSGNVSFTEAQLAQADQVPWSKDVLNKPGLDLPHFLFLGVEVCSKGPLNLAVWHSYLEHGSGIYDNRLANPLEVNKQRLLRGHASHPKFVNDDDLGSVYTYAHETCKFRWYLMPIGLVGAAAGFLHIRQKLPNTYEASNVIERVTANIVYYWQKGKYLDSDPQARSVRTRSLGKRGYEVLITAMCINVPPELLHMDSNGIDASEPEVKANDPDIGIAASRKI
jgi:hypothetical protein